VGRDRSSAGISNVGTLVGLAALLAVLVIVAIVVSVTLPSTPGTTTTTTGGSGHSTTSTTASPAGTKSAAVVAACQSDVRDVQTALAAYLAVKSTFPPLPATWSATSYLTNFAQLTDAPPPGPYLKMPPGDNHYVVLWDSSGHVWIEPPGSFTPTYDTANDALNPTTCLRVAR
jgi:hypothetical protein